GDRARGECRAGKRDDTGDGEADDCLLAHEKDSCEVVSDRSHRATPMPKCQCARIACVSHWARSVLMSPAERGGWLSIETGQGPHRLWPQCVVACDSR